MEDGWTLLKEGAEDEDDLEGSLFPDLSKGFLENKGDRLLAIGGDGDPRCSNKVGKAAADVVRFTEKTSTK